LIKKGIDDALGKVFEVEKAEKKSVNKAISELQKLIEDVREKNTNEDRYLVQAANDIIKANQYSTS
jgi:hypothetical protein